MNIKDIPKLQLDTSKPEGFYELTDREWTDWNMTGQYKVGTEEAKDKRVRWVLEKMKDKNIKTILDVGCGVGWHCRFFKDNGFDIIGTDVSEKGIEIAQKNNPDITFKVENFENVSYDNQYDAVVCLAVLNCVFDWEKLLDNIIKSAKKWVYLTTIDYKRDNLKLHKWVWTMSEMYEILRHKGEVISLDYDPPQLYFELQK